jgi:hypothetical protein
MVNAPGESFPDRLEEHLTEECSTPSKDHDRRVQGNDRGPDPDGMIEVLGCVLGDSEVRAMVYEGL